VVEYLTTTEAAKLLRVKPKTLNNMKARGVFSEGVHFFRRQGLGPRWKRDALPEWLEGEHQAAERFPLAEPGGRKSGAVSGHHSRHQPARLSALPDFLEGFGYRCLDSFSRRRSPWSQRAAGSGQSDSDRRETPEGSRASSRVARSAGRLPATTDAGHASGVESENVAELLRGMDREKSATVSSNLDGEETSTLLRGYHTTGDWLCALRGRDQESP
jgi:hypothetical protein